VTRKGSYTLNVFKTFLIFKGGLPIFLIKNILGVNSFIIIVIARILASVKCRTWKCQSDSPYHAFTCLHVVDVVEDTCKL
jgi:hypothetical protein